LNLRNQLAKLIRIVAFAAAAASMSIAAVYNFHVRTDATLLNLLDIYTHINLAVVGNANGHSIATRFVNYIPPKHGGYAQNIYFLSSYVLWPQRDYVSPPGKVINDGFQLLAANDELPDDAWLARRDVIGTLYLTPAGPVGEYDTVWVPLKPTTAPSQ
jgi:hypothetical protein